MSISKLVFLHLNYTFTTWYFLLDSNRTDIIDGLCQKPRICFIGNLNILMQLLLLDQSHNEHPLLI